VATFHSTILKTIIMIYIEVTYKVCVIILFIGSNMNPMEIGSQTNHKFPNNPVRKGNSPKILESLGSALKVRIRKPRDCVLIAYPIQYLTLK
jgi:hypothetical protein